VLLVLLSMSIGCWALLFYKIVTLRLKMKHAKHAYAIISKSMSFDDLLAKAATIAPTFAGEIIANYLTEFKKMLTHYNYLLSEADWQAYQAVTYQLLDEEIQKEEESLPILSTCAGAAPLLGLFGTVWGLIHAFIGISQQKSADIASVAPGIAEALITTLAGLLVAIPALVMYSYLQNRVRLLEQVLASLTEKCFSLMRIVALKGVGLKNELEWTAAVRPEGERREQAEGL
jgi:biopolymer transport protein ExbB/TolQ